MDCNYCPPPTSLTEIPQQDCEVNLNQTQKLAFQRIATGNQFGPNALPAANDITLLADWQARKTATDNTKIVITPFIGANPVIDAGDAITNGGGDNSTLNGVEEVEGVNPSVFSTEFKGLSPAIERAMKKLMCEKNLMVYFFLQGGKIACVEIDALNQKGLKVESLFFSDRNNAGFATKDTHRMRFSLPAGWSEYLKIITPSFNPLTEL